MLEPDIKVYLGEKEEGKDISLQTFNFENSELFFLGWVLLGTMCYRLYGQDTLTSFTWDNAYRVCKG